MRFCASKTHRPIVANASRKGLPKFTKASSVSWRADFLAIEPVTEG
jgi:hypothetical protein